MTFKIWLYFIGTLGFLGGFYHLLRNKQKFGGWIIILSLLIFVGGSLNIGDLISLTFNIEKIQNIKKEVENIQDDVGDLKLQMSQTLELKQEISQTVNFVTEVKKEIVNLQESINDFYSQMVTEVYRIEDLDKRVKICDDGESRQVCFVLKSIPVEKSVNVSWNSGVMSSSVFKVHKNCVVLGMSFPEGIILKKDKDFFNITYFKDSQSDVKLLDLDGYTCPEDLQQPERMSKEEMEEFLKDVVGMSKEEKEEFLKDVGKP